MPALVPSAGRVRAALRRLWLDERGATAVEYGLLAALIGLAIVTSVRYFGTQLTGTFNQVGAALPH